MQRKNNSVYRNSEGYYDPTAGNALVEIIRAESKKNRKCLGKQNTVNDFIKWFCSEYDRTHGRVKDGKKRYLAYEPKVRHDLNIYLYCIRHADDADFTAERAAEVMETSERIIKQCFEHRGNLWKVAEAYIDWCNDNLPRTLMSEAMGETK